MPRKTSKSVEARSGTLANVVILSDRRRRLGTGMHGKQFGGADVLAFPLKRLDDRRPRVKRNAFSLLPLRDGPMTLANISRHFGYAVPALEKVGKVFHVPTIPPDELSGQVRSTIPLTPARQGRTMRPMGRGTTPARFRDDLAHRLESARVVAGFQTQQQAAQALGIGVDRYRKWESGRTPVPAQFVPMVCDLFRIDANYLFGVHAVSVRKTA